MIPAAFPWNTVRLLSEQNPAQILVPKQLSPSKYKILTLKSNIQAQNFPPPHLYLRSFMRGFFTCIYTRNKTTCLPALPPLILKGKTISLPRSTLMFDGLDIPLKTLIFFCTQLSLFLSLPQFSPSFPRFSEVFPPEIPPAPPYPPPRQYLVAPRRASCLLRPGSSCHLQHFCRPRRRCFYECFMDF